MNSVLLLNADCTPLKVIPVKRAIGLMLAGKAEPMIDEYIAEYCGETDIIPIPSVLRLGYVVTIPFKKMHVNPSKKGILARDGKVCQFVTNEGPCHSFADSVDHVHPKAKGGDKMSWTNLVAACSKHNHKKGCRSLEEMGWKLKREPVAPRAQMRLKAPRYGEVPDSWLQFLTTTPVI